MLGGMMGPNTPPTVWTALAKPGSYPSSSMEGIMMPPTAAVVAAPAPVMAAKIMLATTSTTARPPGIQPTSFLAKSTILREIPPLCIKQPAMTKKGIAIRVKE